MSTEGKEVIASQGRARCERLLQDPDVLWFIAEAITKARVTKDAELKDLKTPKDAREIAAHVREALERVEQFLAEKRDYYTRQMKPPQK